jgi:hypothetical protein
MSETSFFIQIAERELDNLEYNRSTQLSSLCDLGSHPTEYEPHGWEVPRDPKPKKKIPGMPKDYEYFCKLKEKYNV